MLILEIALVACETLEASITEVGYIFMTNDTFNCVDMQSS